MCYFINNLLTSSAHAATLHYTFPVCTRTSRNSAFCVAAGFGGVGVPAPGGGEKPLPLAAFVAPRVFGLTSKRPNTAAT